MGTGRLHPLQEDTIIGRAGPLRERDRRALADLVLLAGACAIGAAASTRLRLAERAADLGDQVGLSDPNGVVAAAVLVPLAVAVYAVRRYHDALLVRAELARISLRDGLTGLPNRLYLTEWLDQELRATRRTAERVGVLFIDLDRFKLINDTHGHDVGDAVLVALAHRVQSCLDPGCRLIRYAGDEFLAFCRQDPIRPTAERLARRIQVALEEPFPVGSDVLRVTASVGVAVHRDRETPDELIRRADAAMYDAKARADGRPVVFDEAVHGTRFSPATLEPHLRTAAEQGDFRLVYQPIVDTVSGEVVAVEALLRWDHPERGPVPPSEFIPVLEESGLIVGVGAWVIDEALRQAQEWHRTFPGRIPLRVGINVSARQLAQSGFEERVHEALAAHPVPPASICLEITEGALMVDIEAAWSALRILKRMGIKLALDDFGTGYSSLSYIRTFSLDMLKIDRSFVAGLGESREDTAIVEHVIGMASALGMVTVGEGVETREQLAELHRLGCDLAQGYLMSTPVEADEISRLLARGGRLARPLGGRAATLPGAGGPDSPSVGPFDRIDITTPVTPADLLAQPGWTSTGAPPLPADR